MRGSEAGVEVRKGLTRSLCLIGIVVLFGMIKKVLEIVMMVIEHCECT